MTEASNISRYRANRQKEIDVMTGRSLLYSGFRQVLFGLGAAGLTYDVGKFIGISVAG